MSRRIIVISLAAAVALASCGEAPPPEAVPERLVLTPVDYSDLPGWADDPVAAVLPALDRSCAHLAGQPDDRPVGPEEGAVGGTVADWTEACAALAAVPEGDDAAARAALEAWFVPFRATAGARETGLVTGYYEAELTGALFPGAGFHAPIFARPDDLVTVDLGRFRADMDGKHIVGRVEEGRLQPYHTRRDIAEGALGGRGLELLWSNDPVDVFFLHIQGSGRVRFPDGSERRVGYAMSNGHEFTGIGRAMIDEGKISRDQASMQSIRDWLRANPDEAAEIMMRNARYIFFRWIDGEGPIGAQGVPLTAGRSLAVDTAVLPLGVPVYLDTTWPADGRPLRRLMVAQDTGAAITGILRADFYWGSGEAALTHAGGMKQQGAFYILLPKPVAERRATTS